MKNRVETKDKLCLCQQMKHAFASKPASYVELAFTPRVKVGDAETVSLFLYAGARRSDEGVTGIVFLAQDVTRRQEAEQLKAEKSMVEAANKAKLEQLQFLCHEIRNPLNGILGNISFMLDTNIDDEQALLVEGTYDRAKQLREVVDDVLDISKINMGAVELEHLSFNVQSLIDTMINFPTEMDRWGEVINDQDCPYPNVMGDPFRIQQILKKFISFCSNCPTDKLMDVVVHVATDCQEPQTKNGKRVSKYTFVVRNDALFVPLSQVNTMFGDVTSGETGILRMTVCKKLAQLLGGEVCCQSGTNGGIKFTLSLDLELVEGNDEAVEQLQVYVGLITSVLGLFCLFIMSLLTLFAYRVS